MQGRINVHRCVPNIKWCERCIESLL